MHDLDWADVWVGWTSVNIMSIHQRNIAEWYWMMLNGVRHVRHCTIHPYPWLSTSRHGRASSVPTQCSRSWAERWQPVVHGDGVRECPIWVGSVNVTDPDGPWRTLNQLISWVSKNLTYIQLSRHPWLWTELFALKMQRRSTRRFPIRLNPNAFLWIRTSSGSSGDNISSYQLHCSNLFQSDLVLALVQCHCHIVQGMIFGDEVLNRSVQLLRLFRQCPQCPATEDQISSKPFLQPNRFQIDSK